MLTSDLDRDYIQELINLQDFKNNGCPGGGLLGSSKQVLVHHLKKTNRNGTIAGKKICCQSSKIMAPSELPRPKQPSVSV